jgi:hypothetical protein
VAPRRGFGLPFAGRTVIRAAILPDDVNLTPYLAAERKSSSNSAGAAGEATPTSPNAGISTSAVSPE